MLFWNNGHLYTAPVVQCSPRHFDRHVPNTTWCLCDSNTMIREVPTLLYEANFVLQVTSPRAERLSWVTKTKTSHFFMRDWSCNELIAGLQLQIEGFNYSTSMQLVEYHKKLGGSSRDAYLNAFQLSTELKNITEKMADLDFNVLLVQPDDAQSSLKIPAIDKRLGHRVACVFPTADYDGSLYEVRTPSTFLMELIWDAIVKKEHANRFDLFQTYENVRPSR
ncbi:hypothetical protein GYMLUDRAFT_908116 [Collybiopsis luxurians FD-317 M1]|nr:hypothetical protein GYMLUDRAFT_908116 [Collybiopsis luxurians FD-317 M1]